MLDDIEFLDDATRPPPQKLEGLTEAQRQPGLHLKMIHDHLRENMHVLGRLIERASAGSVTPAQIESETSGLAMVSNYRRFGNLCGQHCQIVNTHHSIEDYAIFPALAEQGDAFRKIADRLRAEHVVVHELLVRLVDALNGLAREPGEENFLAAREVYHALERVLLSHLGYEEEAMGDAMGYFEMEFREKIGLGSVVGEAAPLPGPPRKGEGQGGGLHFAIPPASPSPLRGGGRSGLAGGSA